MNRMMNDNAAGTKPNGEQCADCGILSQEIQIVGGWPLCHTCAEAARRNATAETQTWRDLQNGRRMAWLKPPGTA